MSNNTATPVLQIDVVQPKELSPNFFTFEKNSSKTWVLAEKFADLVDDTKRVKYKLFADNANAKIKLFEYKGTFDVNTATLCGEADLNQINMQTDDVAIGDNDVLTFTDKETNKTVTFDKNNVLTRLLKANSQAIHLNGDGKTSDLIADLILDPSDDNIATITASGLMIDKADVLAVLNSKKSVAKVGFNHKKDTKKLEINVNDTVASVDTIEIRNSAGELIGYAINAKDNNGETTETPADTNNPTNPPATDEYKLVWKENKSTSLTVNNFLDIADVSWDIIDNNGNSVADTSLDNEYKITYSTKNPAITLLEVSKTGSYNYLDLSDSNPTRILQALTNRNLDVSADGLSTSESFGITIECLSDKVTGILEVTFIKG